MLPQDVVAKDPNIQNLSDIEAYIYADVSIPIKDIILSGNSTAKSTELFSYTVNPGWTLVKVDRQSDKVVYRYVWKDPVPAKGF